jgi:hypothetical protein
VEWSLDGPLPARFSASWFSGVRGEDLNVIFYQNMPNLHNRYKSAERNISQKNTEYALNYFLPKSSPLKLLNQITLNLAGMVLGWVPFKIVSDSPALYSRWLLLLKIEISSIVHCKLTTKEISIFSNSSHFEWRMELSDYPRTIPARFGLIWFSGFN